MIDLELLELLACPVHRAPVTLADTETVRTVNALVDSGRLHDRSGHLVRSRVDDVLVCAAAGCLYPVEHDIPTLLPEEALVLEDVAGG